MQSPLPENEYSRVVELSELGIDYSETQESLKRLAKLAARIAGTDISSINLIDSYTQWSISGFGMVLDPMPREDSVCQYTIASNGVFEVQDLSSDERFKDKSYVTGPSELRYYYGIPLQTKQGNNIGALCLLDDQPRVIFPEKAELLKNIADEIVNRLVLHQSFLALKNDYRTLGEVQRRLAHDIRGPLGGIVSLTELIAESAKIGNLTEVLELLELIHQSGNSLLDLADNILVKADKAQPYQGKESFDLALFKEKLEKLYTPQALSKKVAFKVQLSRNEEAILLPKGKLLQIAGNLISNAIKFTPDGGLVSVELGSIRGEKGGTLEILVRDTGVGITQVALDAIKQGVETTSGGTGDEKGYGIGLQLVQHLVSNLNGTFEIESAVGMGSCFKVVISQQ